jgi:MFS family permease
MQLVCFVDRTNVGMAALHMNQELKLGAAVFGFGAGLLFVGYALFDIPSNLILHRVGAKKWMGIVMIMWGLAAAALGLTQGPHSFYALRFLLGATEAGFVPGSVYFLTLWYPARHRSTPLAYFFSCSVLAGIVMGPLSAWLMKITNGMLGASGWRWMFAFEGLPAIIAGIATLFILLDSPRDAKWLTLEEKNWLIGTLEAERRIEPPVEHHSVGKFLADGRMWIMAGFYFMFNLDTMGIMLWLPLILKASSKSNTQVIGNLYAFFFFCAFVGVHAFDRWTRHTGNRKLSLLLCSFVPFVALTGTVFVPMPALLAYSVLCFASLFIWGLLPLFWTLPGEYMGGKTAAGGLAFVTSMGAVGALVGPWIVGLIKQLTGKFEFAVFALALAFLFQGFFVLVMRIKRRAPGMRYIETR